MGRYPRYLPPTERGSTLVEITCRTVQGRRLLRPDTRLKRRMAGVFARAQELYPTPIYNLNALSSHYHLDAGFDDVGHQRDYLQHVQSNLAREVGRLHDWRAPVWSRRYRSIPVAETDEDQIRRFRYTLEQDCSSYCTSFRCGTIG